MQAAGDHQVQHQPEVAIQADGDALSHSPQFAHSSSRGFRERRRRGSKKKRAGQPDAFERQPHHARFERRNVSRDVRQFGHTSPACMAPAGFARPVGRPYEGEGTEPSAAPGSRRGRLRYGRADEGSETSVRSSVGAPLAKRSGPVNFREDAAPQYGGKDEGNLPLWEQGNPFRSIVSHPILACRRAPAMWALSSTASLSAAVRVHSPSRAGFNT
jgi:hypothetical protein